MCDKCYPKMKEAEQVMIARLGEASDKTLVQFARIIEEFMNLKPQMSKIHTREEAMHFLAWTKVHTDLSKEEIIQHNETVKAKLDELFGEFGIAKVFAGDGKKNPGAEAGRSGDKTRMN